MFRKELLLTMAIVMTGLTCILATQAVGLLRSIKEVKAQLKNSEKKQLSDSKSTNEFVLSQSLVTQFQHVLVIANYNESLDILIETLNILSGHKYAHSYVIVLAMEAREERWQDKAKTLLDTFRTQFGTTMVTAHQLLPDELPGKGSNVAWAVKEVSKAFGVVQDNADTATLVKTGFRKISDECPVLLTIMDVDTHIPGGYIEQLEDTAGKIMDPLFKIYAPLVMFCGRNGGNVPAPVRFIDLHWSAMMIQNLGRAAGGWNGWASTFGLGSPCSTYSLSLVSV
jgi:hypothetical protein